MKNKIPRIFLGLFLAMTLCIPSIHHVSASNDLEVPIVDLEGQWTKNTVRVSFNSNGGGTPPGDQIYAYGIERSLPGQGQMTKPGYTFVGWAESSTATTPQWHAGDFSHTAFGYANAETAASKTLYAVWQANEVSTIADFLGYGKSGSTPTSSNYDTASLVEKVNYLEDRLATLEADTNTIKTNVATLSESGGGQR